jgi:hypothetical protein
LVRLCELLLVLVALCRHESFERERLRVGFAIAVLVDEGLDDVRGSARLDSAGFEDQPVQLAKCQRPEPAFREVGELSDEEAIELEEI